MWHSVCLLGFLWSLINRQNHRPYNSIANLQPFFKFTKQKNMLLDIFLRFSSQLPVIL